jgi:hypothetical protein
LVSSAGGDFTAIEVEGALSASIALDLAASMSAALQLGAKTPWTTPTYATPLHHSCEQLIRPVVWQAAVGSSVPLVVYPSSYRDVAGWAATVTRAPACDYDSAVLTGMGGVNNAGFIQTMPGGRWSFILVSRTLSWPGPLTPLSVPGMRSGDSAFTRCDAAHRDCFLDALIATHWVEVVLPRGDWSVLIRADRLAAMRPLLQELVTQIYTP